jgi:hypothetical protein
MKEELAIFRTILYGLILSVLVATTMLLSKALPYLTGFSMGMFGGFVLLIPLSLVFIFPFTYFLLVNRQADWLEFKAMLGGMEASPHVEYKSPTAETPSFPSTGFDFGGYKVNDPEEEHIG